MDTKEQTKLKPLLSAKDAEELARQSYPKTYTVNSPPDFGCWVDGLNAAMHFYEDKITSGELMVVNTILRSELNSHIRKEHNIAWNAADAAWVTHCAGCGAKIIEG